MALKDKDNKNRAGLRGFANKHFGEDHYGNSFAKQVCAGLLNTFTVGEGATIIRNSYDGKIKKGVMLGAGGMLTGGMVGLVSLVGGLIHSDEYYDGTLAAQDVSSIEMLTDEQDQDGYISFTIPDQGRYLLTRNGDEFQIYQTKPDLSDDDTFLIYGEQDAAYTAARLSSYFELMTEFPAQSKGVSLRNYEAVSNAYVNTETHSLTITGDNPETLVTHNWSAEDLHVLLETASQSIAQDYTISYEGVDTHEILLEAPLDRDNGWMQYMAFGLGALGGLGFATSAIGANGASRRRYKSGEQKRNNYYFP